MTRGVVRHVTRGVIKDVTSVTKGCDQGEARGVTRV